MDDMMNIDKCTSISELVENKDLKKDEEKFEEIFDKTSNEEDIEAIVSVNKSSRTAVITPIVRNVRMKNLVDYESSGSEDEVTEEAKTPKTPAAKLAPKTPKFKRQRSATPHVKKLLTLMRQKVVGEDGESVDGGNEEDFPIVDETTPSINDEASKCNKYISCVQFWGDYIYFYRT